MILVLNAGSSSIKYKLFDIHCHKMIDAGIVQEVSAYEAAFDAIFVQLKDSCAIESESDISACGHRVVHGGEKFQKPTLITQEVLQEIESLIPLAPLHNPSNLKGIQIASKKLPHALQVAVFDTAFHQSLPKSAFMYALPYELYEKYGIRKYGFHGTSHHYVAKEAATYLQKPLHRLNLLTIHLGNGDSITAIKQGKSVDTSMGFTPLEGLMMGTRSGDIDPEIIFYMHNHLGMSPKHIETLLNKKSGFEGVCHESDLRKIVQNAHDNDELSQLALDMFAYRVKKYVGAYKEILGHVDAVVFTGGIGENSAQVRQAISPHTDSKKNFALRGLGEIQSHEAPYKILVIPTNEELEIAKQTKEFLPYESLN